ncbi:MAG: DUF1800 domain-containing protein [Caulobacteraceae bacterium]
MHDDVSGAIAVNRFGLGARPGELAAATANPKAWLKAQIDRRGADQPQGELRDSRDRLLAYAAFISDFRDLKREAGVTKAPAASARRNAMTAIASSTATTDTPSAPGAPTQQVEQSGANDLKAQRRMAAKPLRDGVAAEILARAQLAATTPAPFRERWTLFWANHFTVSTAKAKAAPLVGPFEREAIRPHVFGRFSDLLYASSTHPAMLIYLDQARSTGPHSQGGERRSAGLNENLAREIMELHTVGPDAGYTQADVTQFACALTGYSIGLERDGAEAAGRPLFRPNLHEPGARMVMGRSYSDGGQAQARAIFADLAASPHTADHIARKLAVHFVADEPPLTLVARLSQAFTGSQGDLAVVAAALIDAPEAWSPTAAKFKRPYEFLVSGYRVAGAVPNDADREIVQPLTLLSERPMAAPQPNGWSEQMGDWTPPDAIVKRLNWSAAFADAHAPTDTTAVQVADAALGARLTAPTRLAIARAESRSEAMTLLLMSPEFQRR